VVLKPNVTPAGTICGLSLVPSSGRRELMTPCVCAGSMTWAFTAVGSKLKPPGRVTFQACSPPHSSVTPTTSYAHMVASEYLLLAWRADPQTRRMPFKRRTRFTLLGKQATENAPFGVRPGSPGLQKLASIRQKPRIIQL
jgi:hypothetical protein